MTDFSLTIEFWHDEVHELELEGQLVKIRQTVEDFNDKIKALHIRFELSSPVRFSVQTLIPQDAHNACAILNKQLLISPFRDEWPQDGPDLNLSDCQKKGSAVSTLKPGEFQKISFRWQNNDHLVFYRIIQ